MVGEATTALEPRPPRLETLVRARSKLGIAMTFRSQSPSTAYWSSIPTWRGRLPGGGRTADTVAVCTRIAIAGCWGRVFGCHRCRSPQHGLSSACPYKVAFGKGVSRPLAGVGGWLLVRWVLVDPGRGLLGFSGWRDVGQDTVSPPPGAFRDRTVTPKSTRP